MNASDAGLFRLLRISSSESDDVLKLELISASLALVSALACVPINRYSTFYQTHSTCSQKFYEF